MSSHFPIVCLCTTNNTNKAASRSHGMGAPLEPFNVGTRYVVWR